MRSFQVSLGVILMFFCSEIFAQGFVENALLFSRTKPGGSARIQAMGGAQIALGGDYSSALSNPAGLGMYNRSEFTFSPGLNFYKSSSTLLNHTGTNTADDSKTVFNIPGLSYVHHSPRESGNFLGGSFAITMTRTNDFQNAFQYQGTDDVSSMIDYFEQQAQGFSINTLPNPYSNTPLLNFDSPEGLAYNTFLINPISEASPYPNPFTPQDSINYTTYTSALDTLGTNEVRTLNRKDRINLRGAQYQWSFAYGGNIADKFFFGAAIGVTTLRYKYSSSYSENGFTYSSGYTAPIDNFRLDQNIEIDGSGVNLTVGIVYRFIEFAQVGVSLVTPTYYNLTDTYNARLRADWDGFSDEDESSEPIVSEYNLTTPLKLNTGIAVFAGKYGVITGDIEFVNYGKAKYNSNSPGVTFKPDNDNIKYYYSNVINYRIGAEARLDIVRLRGGYNLQNNPYKSTFNLGSSMTTLSAGVGVRLDKFFIDGTFLNTRYNSSYSPYTVTDEDNNVVGPVARLKNSMNSAMLTVGFTF
ncbi:MAG: hypothetical protein JNK18_03775 [Cyclobacteriaceae bacterium]|nr:hypothetical protein [Cyclobacteriaceae bacterium]